MADDQKLLIELLSRQGRQDKGKVAAATPHADKPRCVMLESVEIIVDERVGLVDERTPHVTCFIDASLYALRRA